MSDHETPAVSEQPTAQQATPTRPNVEMVFTALFASGSPETKENP